MKKNKIGTAAIFLCLLLGTLPALAQKELAYPDFKGISYESEDGVSAKIKFNARIQNRLDLSSEGNEGLSPTEILFRTRRMRLKAAGYLLDPRLSFKLELAFSRNDLSGELGDAGNILDAYMEYALTDDLGLRFGQFKVPGNRERVISSGSLSLVDRSILNSAYNLDRDIGLMLLFEKELGPTVLGYYAMISNGEGKNILSTRIGINDNQELDLAFTQRVEFLPFGPFEDGGDYFEADLLFEETPKLSVGAGYTHNNDAVRARGQRSSLLFEPRNINTTFVDMIFKYQGWSLMAEYMDAQSENAITESADGEQEAVRTGDGYMVQGGYVWPSMWSLVARYSETTPDEEVNSLFYDAETEVRLALSKYLRGHRIKVQSDIGYLSDKGLPIGVQDFWEWRFQVELGF